MKSFVLITAILLLVVNTITAQKKAMEFSNEQNYNLNDVYSVIKDSHTKHDYIISQSDVLIPINFEDLQSNSESSNPNSENNIIIKAPLNPLYTEGTNTSLSFHVFTIVDTNSFDNLEDLNTQTLNDSNILKTLPENFNPYKGMLLDRINLNTITNPVTSR